MRWWHFALIGAGVVVCLELGLRFGIGLGDPPLVTRDDAVEYRLQPSKDYRRFGNAISINRYGMRAPDHPPEKALNERRILLIGDSVIYGNHFIDQSDTIAARLRLELSPTPYCPVIIMPAAASSWGPVNQAAFLADVGTLDADMAIFLLSSHDLYDTPSFEDHVIPYRLTPSFGALHDAAQIVWERWAPGRRVDRPRDPIDLRRRQTIAALDRIDAQLAKAGIRMVLVYHPTRRELENGLHSQADEFASWAREKGHRFEALTDHLSSTQYRDGIHPNAAGAAQIASRFYDLTQDVIHACPHS